MTKLKSALLLGGIAAIVAVAPSGARAQVADGSAALPPAGAEEESSGLEDIVVTAQRRAEAVQDVPIAIATVSAALAERTGVSGTESLTIAVPGLQFSRQVQNGGAPFIRGVGSAQATAGAESPVALYVDDVYIGTPATTLTSFNNIEQIAVLKGPQGTLFGRNATGGVVQITTKRPSHETSIDVTAGYGNFQTAQASLYATTGLSETIAVNFAATGLDQGKGYGLNLTTGQDVYKQWQYGFRGEILWEPTSATSLLLIGDYSRYHGDLGQNLIFMPGAVGVGNGRYRGEYRAQQNPQDITDSDQFGFSGRLDHDFGGVRLASITAYRENTLDYTIDFDGTAAPILLLDVQSWNRTFSQELQLLSPAEGAFQWIVGAFYYRAKAAYDPLWTRSAAPNFLYAKQTVNSYAGFGEVSYELTPDTKITGGLRYTTDEFDFDVRQVSAAGAPINNTPFNRQSKFSAWTYRAVLDHHFTPDIMAYASHSRGFKSGGYPLSAPTVVVGGVAQPAPVVAPEVLYAYEVGLKTELFDRKLRLNVAAFHYDYKNLQVTVIGAGVSRTLNAAAAKMDGVDIDFTATPFRGLTLTGGMAFLDARFSSFPNGPLNVPNPAVCTPVPQTTGPLTGGNTTCPADLTGLRTSRSPKFTGSFSATYAIDTGIGEFALTGSIYHNSGYVWDPDNRLRQPKYDLVNANLAWTSPEGTFEARLWVKNLFDKYYYSFASGSAFRDAHVPEAPRTYGLTLGAHF